MVQTGAITLAQSGILLAFLAAFPAVGAANTNSGTPGAGDRFNPCAGAPALEPGEPVRSVLAEGAVHCYAIELRRGEYLKLTIHGIGRAAGAELWLPGRGTREDVNRRIGYGRGEVRGGSQVLTAVAEVDGAHRVTVGPILDGGPPLPYRIEVTELLAADRYHERLESAKSDPRVEWLRENAVTIRSIAPEDEDFSDLRPLEEILEGVDVVMLGEATHRDAPTFHAKTRLVEFLHQEMGFDVLAFENSLYGMWKMWRGIRAGENPRKLTRRWMFGLYDVREFQPLLEYVERSVRSERPLTLAGLGFVGWGHGGEFLGDLESFLDRIGVDVEGEPAYERVHATLSQVFRALDETGRLPADYISGDVLSELRQAVAALQEVIRSRGAGDREASLWIQLLNGAPSWLELFVAAANIRSQLPENLGYYDLKSPDWRWDWEWCKSKDRQMAEYLVWLAEDYFAGRKIIVWAHTGHLYRNTHTISPPGVLDHVSNRCLFQYKRLEAFTSMGHDVHRALGDRVYTLSTISYQGEWRGPINRDQVEELELEEMFYLAGHEYALLDLRSLGEDGAWLHDRLYARTAPHQALSARWPAVLDGFLFIRETWPSMRLLPEEADP